MDEYLFKSNTDYFKKCLNTLLEKDKGLLEKRNYNIDNFNKDFNDDLLNDICKESKYEMIFQSKDNPKKFIYILFVNTVNILSKNFKAINIKKRLDNFTDFIKENLNIEIENEEDIEVDMCLIITNLIKLNLLVVSRKLFDKLKLFTNINIRIEIFLYKELLFNITKHCLIPNNFYILNNKEINKLLEIYNLKNIKQLPCIKKTDPLAKFYGLNFNNIIRIIRPSSNSGYYISYRVCI